MPTVCVKNPRRTKATTSLDSASSSTAKKSSILHSLVWVVFDTCCCAYCNLYVPDCSCDSIKGRGSEDEGDEDEDLRPRGVSSQPRPPSETRRKIKNARRKLLGENPAAILVDDLAQVNKLLHLDEGEKREQVS